MPITCALALAAAADPPSAAAGAAADAVHQIGDVADVNELVSRLFVVAPTLIATAVVLGFSWKWWLKEAVGLFVQWRRDVRAARLAETRANREAKASALRIEREAEAAAAKMLHDSRANELELQRKITEANSQLAQSLDRGLAASGAMLATMGSQLAKLEHLSERFARTEA